MDRRSTASACIVCHKRKVKCDLQVAEPCTNCTIWKNECKPHKRKRKHYTNSPSPPSKAGRLVSPNRRDERVRSETQIEDPDSETSGMPEQLPSPQAVHQQSTNLKVWQVSEDVGNASTTEVPSRPSRSRAVNQGKNDPESYLGRQEYLGGCVPFNEEMTMSQRSSSRSGCAPSNDDLKMLQQQRAFELPPKYIRDSLINDFMRFCAPWNPIVDASWLEETSKHQPSFLLLQAIFLAGSRVSSVAASYAPSEEFYRRAKLLFFFGYEQDPIISIVAACLLHWWNPIGPETISMDTSGFWMRTASGLAFQVGLHKEKSLGKNRMFRRRLWWTLVVRDNIISVGCGRPRTICLCDSDVRQLTLEDFPPEDHLSSLFIAYCSICCLLGEVTECRLQRKLTHLRRTDFKNAAYRWIKELPPELRLFQTDPTHGLGVSSFEARQLLVVYLAVLIILNRPSAPDDPSAAVSLVASSLIAGIYETFLKRNEIGQLGCVFTFFGLCAGLSQLSAYCYPSLRAAAGADLETIKLVLQKLSQRWGSATGSLRALNKVAEAVQQQKPISAPLPIVNKESLSFINDFGPELCRLWDLANMVSANSVTNVAAELQIEVSDTSTGLSLAEPGLVPEGNSFEETQYTSLDAGYHLSLSGSIQLPFDQNNWPENENNDWIDVDLSWLLTDWTSERFW